MRARSCMIAGNPPIEASIRMRDNERQRQVHRAATEPPTSFSTSVASTARGEWLTTVDLGEGVTLSKLFEHEDEARGYGDELVAWLRCGQSE